MKIIIAMLIKGPKAIESLKFFFFNKIKIIEKTAPITKASLKIKKAPNKLFAKIPIIKEYRTSPNPIIPVNLYKA